MSIAVSSQALFMGKQYRRSLAIIRNSGLIEADIQCRYLAARCLAEVRDWEECLIVLGAWDESDVESAGLQVRRNCLRVSPLH